MKPHLTNWYVCPGGCDLKAMIDGKPQRILEAVMHNDLTSLEAEEVAALAAAAPELRNTLTAIMLDCRRMLNDECDMDPYELFRAIHEAALEQLQDLPETT